MTDAPETEAAQTTTKEPPKSGALKVLKRLVLIVVVLLLVAVGVAYLLPSHVHAERSIVINAPPEVIFAKVNDLKEWTAWSPWYAMEPTAKYDYSGAESGVGAIHTWKGDKVGEGKQEITKSESAKRIESSLDFGPQGTATSNWTFEAAGEGTKVTWGFDTDLGMNPIGRYFGLMMDSMIGAQYEEGLASLKKVCEADDNEPAAEPQDYGESNNEGSAATSPTDGEPDTNSKE